MAKRFNFDEAITTDIKGAASDSYIDNIKMIKVTDIETNSENFYSLPDIEELRKKKQYRMLKKKSESYARKLKNLKPKRTISLLTIYLRRL